MRNVSLAHWECVKLGDTVPIPKCASIEHSFRVFLWHLAYPEIQAINIPSQLVVDGSHARPGDSSELVIYPPLIKCVNFPIKLIDNFPINMSIEWGGFSIDTFDYQRDPKGIWIFNQRARCISRDFKCSLLTLCRRAAACHSSFPHRRSCSFGRKSPSLASLAPHAAKTTSMGALTLGKRPSRCRNLQ